MLQYFLLFPVEHIQGRKFIISPSNKPSSVMLPVLAVTRALQTRWKEQQMRAQPFTPGVCSLKRRASPGRPQVQSLSTNQCRPSWGPLATWHFSLPLGPPFLFLPFRPSLSAALPHSLPLSPRLLHGLRYARLFSLGSPEGTLEILCGGTPHFVLIWCCWCGPPAAGLCVFLVVWRSFMFICLDGRARTIREQT